MLPALDTGRNLTQRATFRLLAFLTLVLAPIGIIAVFQTQALNTELRNQGSSLAPHSSRPKVQLSVGAPIAVTTNVPSADPIAPMPSPPTR